MKDIIEIKNINKYEAARYLGYKDSLPDVEMTKIILTCEQELLKVIRPQYVYKIFDIYPDVNGIIMEGTTLILEGKSIKEHLDNCDKAAVMCTTLSADVDKLLRTNEITNMVNALIIDALANAAIEQVCDEVERIIQKKMPEYCHTWRFGVGYGDFPLSTQSKFLEVLNAAKEIGVCSTDTSILTPRKSITCVLGLSKKQIGNREKSCEDCNLYQTCNLRKNGTSCFTQ